MRQALSEATLLIFYLKNNYRNIIVLDKLTYAGNIKFLPISKIKFFQGDICDKHLVSEILKTFDIDTVINIAAETHVCNSIEAPEPFIYTNINGTATLLKCCMHHWKESKPNFKYIQVSTDEVYGSLSDEGMFSENSLINPTSPYAASKAGADLLVQAWYKTYNFPIVITRCSNNYGPRQYPEKIIPKTITSCLLGNNIPVHGNGQNIRDWIHVEDHCKGILLALEKGKIGEVYNFGGNKQLSNISVIEKICNILDIIKPLKQGAYKQYITYTDDRPGNDYRYALNFSKAYEKIGFYPEKNFDTELKRTISWYISHLKLFDIKNKNEGL